MSQSAQEAKIFNAEDVAADTRKLKEFLFKNDDPLYKRLIMSNVINEICKNHHGTRRRIIIGVDSRSNAPNDCHYYDHNGIKVTRLMDLQNLEYVLFSNVPSAPQCDVTKFNNDIFSYVQAGDIDEIVVRYNLGGSFTLRDKYSILSWGNTNPLSIASMEMEIVFSGF